MEVDLRHAQKLQAIGVLAGGVAHDFNNILTAIAGYVELAQDLVSKDSEAYSHLDQVTKASTRASDLVRGLLMFSRKGAHSPDLISVAQVVTEALEPATRLHSFQRGISSQHRSGLWLHFR